MVSPSIDALGLSRPALPVNDAKESSFVGWRLESDNGPKARP
jgi:hypothetical protein